MKIAAAAYPIEWLEGWDAYAAKLGGWVARAEADLLVFPEYGAMELASLAGVEVAGDLAGSTAAVSDLMGRVDALHQDLAARFGCHILAGSAPVQTELGVVNRARLITPEGVIGVQDKQIMTRFEREVWGIVPGGPLRVFETALGRIGVLICYDAEFPLLGRALIEAGAEILLVPSCTDALAGAARVRIGAMARALEGQCVVAMSATVSSAGWSPAVDENHGQGAVFGPPDLGFPDDGVLAEGAVDAPGWTRAEVDLDTVRRVRAEGQVYNFAHWGEQNQRLAVETVAL